jgi:hypothetical protein
MKKIILNRVIREVTLSSPCLWGKMLNQPKIVNAGSRESIAAIFSLNLPFGPFAFTL